MIVKLLALCFFASPVLSWSWWESQTAWTWPWSEAQTTDQQAVNRQPQQTQWNGPNLNAVPNAQQQPAPAGANVFRVDNRPKNAPEGQTCQRLQDCKMPGQVKDYEYHPDYMCLEGVCRKYLLPGEHGCVADIQCYKKCKESHCAKEPEYLNEYGEAQCRCNHNKQDNGTMYLYADKCWAKCPSLTRPNRKGLTWECVNEQASPSWTSKLQEFHSRSKRQMSRIMC